MSHRSTFTLPQPIDALVGRVDALARVREAIVADARLVTITGPVGVGKTRLAIEAARLAVADGVVDAACFCDSSELASKRAEIEARGDVLVVLDDVDDVLDETRKAIAESLAADTRLLVTSRTRLGSATERVIDLAPLVVPQGDELDGEAAEYFLRCARKARAGYAPAAGEERFVAALVRELDGLPLALSLAAPRLAVMGPAALLHRLRSSRSMLTARPVDAASRHQSFDAALEGTWQALAAWERDALAQLSVFDGFTVDAAEAVLDSSANGMPRVVEALEVLRDKSLLSVRDVDAGVGGELRLHVLFGVADFARRRSDPRVLAAARDRHAAYYARLAARGRVDAERGNLRFLIDRVLASTPATVRAAEPALWAMLALADDDPDAPSPHAQLLERVLDATQNSGADPLLIGRALALRGAHRRQRGELAGATRDLGHALNVARTVGAADLEATALLETTRLLADSGDLDGARTQAQKAVARLGGAGMRGAEANALLVLADVEARRRDLAAARAMVERALALATSIGDAASERRAQTALARGLLDLGDRDAARGAIATAVAECDAADARSLAELDLLDTIVLHDEGELRRALDRYAACAENARRRSLAAIEASALVHRAIACIERGGLAEAYAELRAALVVATGATRALADALIVGVAGSTSPAIDLGVGVRARLVARAFDRALAPAGTAPPPAPETLVVGGGGRWFRAPSSEPTSLERRRPLAQILEHLAQARQSRPGAAVAWEELQRAAWPGERMLASAGAHRVRVAVSALRKLGLRAQLLTRDDGYLLDPGCPIARVEDA